MDRGSDRPDLVVRGRIVTLPDGPPDDLGIVEAIAIGDGRVLAAGTAADVEGIAATGARRIDLAPDEVALPGLTDAHLHLADAAVAAGQLDLADAATPDDALALIRAAHERLATASGSAAVSGSAGGEWLRGAGWDAARWGRWPTAADLDRVAPGRPLLLWSHDLHSVWVSTATLALAGVDRDTRDPAGGVIRRLEDGSPSGVLLEDATGLVTSIAPRPDVARLADLIEAYGRRLLALGVVAVHEPGELESDDRLDRGFAAIERLSASGRLPVRVHASIRRAALEVAIGRGLRSGDPLGIPLGPPDGRGRVGWLKLFGDGTLGSRTALLLDPYEPEPARGEPPGGPLGVAVTSAEELADLAERAAVGGVTTQIHAIGDRALRGALDALAPTAGRTALRPRIEHVQLADQADMPRFAAHGIFASVQPHHLSGDAPRVRPTWGDRARNSYPWRRLADFGAVLAFGTDAPTDSVDPWPGLAMAITRRDPVWADDSGAFFPNEVLTIGQALRASCVGPALASGELDRGRLVTGHRADLVVVPAGVLSDAEVLRSARPRLVLMDGVPVHEV